MYRRGGRPEKDGEMRIWGDWQRMSGAEVGKGSTIYEARRIHVVLLISEDQTETPLCPVFLVS